MGDGERNAREYIRSLLGYRPFMIMRESGRLYGYSPDRLTIPEEWKCRRIRGEYYCWENTGEGSPDEKEQEGIRKAYLEGKELSLGRDFRDGRWYMAALGMALRGYDWGRSRPVPRDMRREAVVMAGWLRNMEADAIALSSVCKGLGGDGEEYLERKAPWLTERARVRRMAEEYGKQSENGTMDRPGHGQTPGS